MIEPRRLRIAITGASSTGKTTLAEGLMRQLRFSRLVDIMIPEGTRTLLLSHGHTSFDTMTRQELQYFQRQFFQRKKESELKAGSYLVDRAFTDVAATWIERDTFDKPIDLQNELVIPCRDLSKRYTLHIHLPALAFPFEHDGVRESDLSLHHRINIRIQQYLVEWELQYISLQSLTLDLRIEEICVELERRGLTTPQT